MNKNIRRKNILKDTKDISTQSCSQCGMCCRLFLINVTKKEWESGYYKTPLKQFFLHDSFTTVQKYGGNIIAQKKDGSCIYLKHNMCSIHTKRPHHCKKFFCSSTAKKYKDMIRIINESKNHGTMQGIC